MKMPFPFWRKIIWIILSNLMTTACFVVVYHINEGALKNWSFYVMGLCLFMASITIDMTKMNNELEKYYEEIKQDLAKVVGVKYE
jgi:bacteriorhodopsin